MFISQAIFVTLLAFSLETNFVNMSSVENMSAMQSNGVVPDIIDFAPSHTVHVSYDSGLSVDQGNELTPTQVQNEPIKVEWPVDDGACYTLCMIDPDAPSRAEPTLGQVLHWLVVNIQGNVFQTGEVVTQYIGSGAPKGTGLHRYIFLVYKQPGPLDCDEPRVSNRSREGRISFSIRKFAAKYNLGHPVAANLFRAQYDDYVPKLHDQLAG